VLRRAAHLPDAAIGFAPLRHRHIDLLHDQRPHAVIEPIPGTHVQADRIEQHAPHVVLSGVGGGIRGCYERPSRIVTPTSP